MTKATHFGECQICGSAQLLPNGLLSKHGYTVKWGFFSGVCAGAGHLPFEQSKDQIAGVIQSVEQTIATVEAQIAELENLDSETNGKLTAWRSVYHRNGDTWEQVEVVDFNSSTYGNFTSYRASTKRALLPGDRHYEPGKTVVERIEAYDAAWKLSSVRHWVRFLNCKRAAALRRENEQRRSWIDWQNTRCAGWTVKPLRSREESK